MKNKQPKQPKQPEPEPPTQEQMRNRRIYSDVIIIVADWIWNGRKDP